MAAKSSKNPFHPRENLLAILKREKSFKIQIFSLESVEMFERFLESNKVSYTKDFTSSFAFKRNIALLLDDGPIENPKGNTRLILYSNLRNYKFVPYKFKLSHEEKKNILKSYKIPFSKNMLEFCKGSSLTSAIAKDLTIHRHALNVLSYAQSIIVMCMVKESKFARIFNEVKTVDPELNNRFVVKCELNYLSKIKICSKVGDSYRLAISNQAVQEICEIIGFESVFQR